MGNGVHVKIGDRPACYLGLTKTGPRLLWSPVGRALFCEDFSEAVLTVI